MWPFYLDRSVSLSKRMHGSVPQVREMLLDIDSFVRLNPYVIKVEQDPANPQKYKITDRLPGLGHLWEYENSIHAVFTPKDDERGQGMDTTVSLPQTVLFPKLQNQYRVKETDEPGVVEVTEVVKLQALSVLVPYILSTMTKAHLRILDRLAEKVESASGAAS